MEEQKEKGASIPWTATPKGSWGPDFSWIGNLKLQDLEIAPVKPSIISEINAAEKLKQPKVEVRLENLGMGKEEIPEEGRVQLGDSGIGETKKKYFTQYRRLFLISFFIILVTGFASIILRLYSRYVYYAAQAVPDANFQTYIDTYKKWQEFLDKLLNLSNYQQYVSLSIKWASDTPNIDKVISDTSLNYIQKKDILQKALNELASAFITNNQKLTTLKENVAKYGFSAQEMYDMLEADSYSTSIKKYLISLEIIKFSSAIKVFGYMDTFVSSLASALNISQAQVELEMQTFADRGEKDILVYLNNCYLNPYEIDYNCNLVGDFDRYYKLIDKEPTPPNINFFKNMMYYVDTKLEQTDLPSFSITFTRYDPTEKLISFNVDVNTFKQDEVALIKKWIINPHIFIISNLLNLIKQSMFVVGENIDAKAIKITPKTIKIGTSIYNVNNSTMTFSLPIQKWSQREISDYVEQSFISSP